MKKEIGHSFATADSADVMIAKPNNGKLFLVGVMTTVHPGLTNEDATIMDGTATIGQIDVTTGITNPMGGTLPIEIDNTLKAQVSNTAIKVSAYATTG